MNDGSIPSFWGEKIPPQKSIFLDFPPETILRITSFAFGSIESDEPSKITANVNTLLIEDEKSIHGDECDAFKHDQIVLGTLTPNKVEQMQVNIQFSPLDIIEVHNSGSNEVHISGYLDPIGEEFSEEEEEEEEKNDITDPDVVQNRFAAMASNQPPKPVIQKKKKNKKKKKNDNEQNDLNENDNEASENSEDNGKDIDENDDNEE
ncbi:peptidylprolyl isomerase fpr3 [Tritrichomonas musculus]|uniref:Peptidylprolyl isomerase fpr3 n=1 Tax=Tritrichomonas musculus TaxID=1915356 RepID=A0ABR2KX87_9EUKA